VADDAMLKGSAMAQFIGALCAGLGGPLAVT
jgi:hypothetical protein